MKTQWPFWLLCAVAFLSLAVMASWYHPILGGMFGATALWCAGVGLISMSKDDHDQR